MWRGLSPQINISGESRTRVSPELRSGYTYVTVSNGVHGQQVVSMAKLELDHIGGRLQCRKLRLLCHAHLLHEVSEEQRVFAHPLNGLQQVGGQVHLIAQLQLLPLQEQGGQGLVRVQI